MRLLVLGRGGQLGTELLRQAERRGHVAMAPDRATLNLSEPEACAGAVRDADVDAVLNAAAYTAVDRAESEPDQAQRVNAEAPGAMARAAAERGLPFLHVSTDYVFDGSGDRPWNTADKPAPLSSYGRSKLAGERQVAGAGGWHAILRTSWSFSAHGGNFVKTMLRLAESRDRLTVVSDQIGGPTPMAALAAAMLDMAEAGSARPGGLFHFSGTPEVSWADFAREIFAQTGGDVAVQDIPSSDYQTPALRPLNSRLDCSRILETHGIARPDWRVGLADVLAELNATERD